MKSLQTIKLISIVTVIFLILSVNAQMRVFGDLEGVEYIQTEHFNIIYKQELANIARETALIAEAQYDTLSGLMNSSPVPRINILITDQADIPNGFATAIMDMTINLYLTNPGPDFIVKHRHWIEFVLLHEMTHILNLSATSPSWLKYFNNNLLYFPNTFMPMWILEGVTVYNESTILSGRLRDTNYEAYLRAMTLDNRKHALYRATDGLNRHWPYGNLGYLYGGYMVEQFMERRDDISVFNRINACTCIPLGIFFPDIMTRIQTGYWPADMLDAAFSQSEKRTEMLTSSINADRREHITHNGGMNSNPLYVSELNTLFFNDYSDYRSDIFVRYDEEGAEDLFFTSKTQSVFYDNNSGRFFFDYLDIKNNVDYFYDIYTYSTDSGETVKLKNTGRGMLPVVGPNGYMYFVRNSYDSHYLIKYDLSRSLCTDSLLFDNTYRFHSMDIDNNSRIIAGIYREGGFSDIAIINFEGESIDFITSGSISDFKAKWSDRYNGFYFISDYSGVNAVYLYSFEDSLMHTVYESHYNVLDFSVDETGNTIYIEDLSGDGYDIYKSDLTVSSSGIRPVFKEYTPYEPVMNKDEFISDAHSYKPFLHYSSPGTYLFLPYIFPPPDSLSTTSTIGIAGFNMNSDIAQGSGYQATIAPFNVLYDSADSSYLYTYSFALNMHFLYFNPSFYPYIILQNDSSGIMPDYKEAGLTITKDFYSYSQSKGLSVSLAGASDSSLFIAPSLSLYMSTLDGGIKSIIPSTGVYSSFTLTPVYNVGSSTLDYRFNIVSNLYDYIYGNNSWFIKLHIDYSTLNDIAVSGYSGLLPDIPIALNRVIYLPESISDSTGYRDFSYINIGTELPLAYPGLGIPLKWFASTPIQLDYISFEAYSFLLYSSGNDYRNMLLGTALNTAFSIGGMVGVKPQLSVNYLYRENTFNIGVNLNYNY
ncbi:MAG: hypothetical protein R6U31_01090 [bacterium]